VRSENMEVEMRKVMLGALRGGEITSLKGGGEEKKQ